MYCTIGLSVFRRHSDNIVKTKS